MLFFNKTIIKKIVVLASFLFIPGILYSQDNDSRFKISFSERFRLETWDNAVTLSKAAKSGSTYARFKTNAMVQWFPGESTELAVKLGHEFRSYLSPTTGSFYMNEIFFDQLYYKQKLPSIYNSTVTLGRQNINLGEGFLVSDGTPLDGSRSFYFNAAKIELQPAPSLTFTFFGLYQPKVDKFLVINGNDIDPSFLKDGSFTLTDQDEAGGGLYYTGKFTDFNLQSYYIRKDYLNPDVKLNQYKAGVNTFGSRINAALCSWLNLTAEGAYQFGNRKNFKQNAFGLYSYLDYNLPFNSPAVPKTWTAGIVYLSGDDASTTRYEGWDPVFSRWPKWSDLLIYTMIKEFGGPAYWSNVSTFYTTFKFGFTPKVNLALTYQHVMAPEYGKSTDFVSGTGKDRGDLFISKLVYEISENVTGHMLWEHFIPGNYYFAGANSSNWVRVEFTLSY